MTKLRPVIFSVFFLVLASVALAQAVNFFSNRIGQHLAEDPDHIATSMIIDLSNAAIQLEILNSLSARLAREFGEAAREEPFVAEEVSRIVSEIRFLYQDAGSRAIELISSNESQLSQSQEIVERFLDLEDSGFSSDLEFLQFILARCNLALAIIDENGPVISSVALSILNENRELLALTYSARRESF
jgi:hypothetical protein